MDRSLYIAMSGAKETLLAQTANNHNLANASTNGFKADLSAFQSRAVHGPGYASRVYSTDATVGWDNTTGALTQTGQPLDVAVQGDGWIAVQGVDGQEAYTRAGDLHVDVNGLLQTATGHPVLGDNGPISIPPYSAISVGRDGTISIVPVGQQANTMAAVARIKLVNPPASNLQRGDDGLFRTNDGQPAQSDASVALASGVLESSNVNVADAMVQMIELARRFDLQVKAMKNTDDNAQVTAKLLGLS
ncbi:MAG: flagellar basal-body rod protein FlgF [Steroidobacter sp.]|jgi:flagellar basal-body rod protein FlgF